jgi:hypothetical protein
MPRIAILFSPPLFCFWFSFHLPFPHTLLFLTFANSSWSTKIELQKIIDAQTRELALISSAWYEMQGRLHNNNIPVSRYRHGSSLADAQKGWLARQRSVVAGR